MHSKQRLCVTPALLRLDEPLIESAPERACSGEHADCGQPDERFLISSASISKQALVSPWTHWILVSLDGVPAQVTQQGLGTDGPKSVRAALAFARQFRHQALCTSQLTHPAQTPDWAAAMCTCAAP